MILIRETSNYFQETILLNFKEIIIVGSNLAIIMYVWKHWAINCMFQHGVQNVSKVLRKMRTQGQTFHTDVRIVEIVWSEKREIR